MPKSSKMFVEQSHLTMPTPVWLHVNGVSITTDMHSYKRPPADSYDYRTKHLQSPVQPTITTPPPLISSSSILPCSITMIDGFYLKNMNTNRPYQKLENTDLPKKLFIDRQIKKAKSLPGLIKGTALARHTPVQSSTYTTPTSVNSSTNHTRNGQTPVSVPDNENDSTPTLQTNHENSTEIRRPRVYFANFNKVQFINENNETSKVHQIATHYPDRRHRRRLTKKTMNTNSFTPASPTTTQQTQILQNLSRPSTHQFSQDISIKKQTTLVSSHSNSLRNTNLPDILNQSLIIDPPSSYEYSNGKYILQRDKSFIRISKPIIEIPSAFSTDTSSEDIHPNNEFTDSHIQHQESEIIDSNNGLFNQANSSISSSTSMTRQRPSLRSISLRQQFMSPIKLKIANINQTNNTINHYQQTNNQTLNTRRSASYKQTNSQNFDEHNDQHFINSSLFNVDNRPSTNTRSYRNLKRSDAIHLTPNKTHLNDTREERFQNLLTIVRPPYTNTHAISTNVTTLTQNNSTTRPMNPNHTNGRVRSSRSISARNSFGIHRTPNTIIV